MTPKETARYCVKQSLSNCQDNIHRANLAAQHNPLDKEWGQSGKTLGQIIDGYKQEELDLATALAWVDAQP